jgi:hypothetical protein
MAHRIVCLLFYKKKIEAIVSRSLSLSLSLFFFPGNASIGRSTVEGI